MARLLNWHKEVINSNGTGDLTLTGIAPAGFVPLSQSIALGEPIPYIIEDGLSNAREAGIGYLSTATNFKRTKVFEKIEGGVYTFEPGTPMATSQSSSYLMLADIAQHHPTTSYIANGSMPDASGNAGNVRSIITPFDGMATVSGNVPWSSTGGLYYSDTQVFTPFRVNVAGKLTGMACLISVAGSGYARLALYSCRPDNGLPGQCIWDSGTAGAQNMATVNASNPLNSYASGAATYINPGNYWFSFLLNTDSLSAPTVTYCNQIMQFAGVASTGSKLSPIVAYRSDPTRGVPYSSASLPSNPALRYVMAADISSGYPSGVLIFGGA